MDRTLGACNRLIHALYEINGPLPRDVVLAAFLGSGARMDAEKLLRNPWDAEPDEYHSDGMRHEYPDDRITTDDQDNEILGGAPLYRANHDGFVVPMDVRDDNVLALNRYSAIALAWSKMRRDLGRYGPRAADSLPEYGGLPGRAVLTAGMRDGKAAVAAGVAYGIDPNTSTPLPAPWANHPLFEDPRIADITIAHGQRFDDPVSIAELGDVLAADEKFIAAVNSSPNLSSEGIAARRAPALAPRLMAAAHLRNEIDAGRREPLAANLDAEGFIRYGRRTS